MMGCVDNVTATKFPKQGDFLNQPVRVLFHYGAGGEARGKIVRYDIEAPGVGIIQLDDGRCILLSECQYQPLSLALPAGTA